MKKLLTVAVLAFSLTGFAQKVYIPNAFSPDGDSRNDVWKPIFNDTSNVEDYELEIFSRQGSLIFQTKDSSVFWDGTFWDVNVSESTFVYRLVARIDNDDVREEGFIQIVR
jgi:gliding motility-associated-like protein